MTIKGYTDNYGDPVLFDEIDPIHDAARFNSSPATLVSLIRQAQDRSGLPDGITASQAGAEIRQLWLQETCDFYPTTGEAMSAYSGTLKHEQINVDSDQLIVEQRYVSTRNQRISGRIDHAAIVDPEADNTLVADLYDLKTMKFFGVTLAWKDLWKNKPEYAWQLNLCALLMEENGVKCRGECEGSGQCWSCDRCQDDARNGPHACDLCHGSGVQPIRVRNLWLECVPADSSYQHEDEARRLGIPDYRKVLIPVTRRPADVVYAHYERLLAAKDQAKADGWAPICKERWSNRKVQNLRCLKFCPVKQQCIDLSALRGESHPLVEEEADVFAQLAASLEVER